MTDPQQGPHYGTAVPPSRRPSLLERPYLAGFAAGLLLVVLAVLADDRSGSGSGMRSSDSIARVQRSALTQEVLRDLYSVRGPAAVRAEAAAAHQLALFEGSQRGEVDEAILPELALDDTAALNVNGPIALPLQEAGYDPERYVEDDIERNSGILLTDFARREARADDQHRAAIALKGLMVLVTFAVVLAVAARELGQGVQRPLVAASWLLTLVSVPLAIVVS
jgi:hypothetical protein